MRHSMFPRHVRRDVTTRRIARAKQHLNAEVDALPLFAEQIKAEQESPEERIARLDAEHEAQWQALRDFVAKQWRQSRKRLAELGKQGEEIRAEWQRSSWPASSEYLATLIFVRTQKREVKNGQD